MTKKISVGSKIFVVFFASILIFVVVLGTITYSISKNIVIEKSSNGYNQTITQATQKIDLLFDLYENITNQVLSDVEIKRESGIFFDASRSQFDLNQAENRVKTILRQIRYSLPAIESISLIAPDVDRAIVDTENQYVGDQGATWMDQVIQANGKVVWLDTTIHGYTTQVSNPSFAIGRMQNNYYGSNKSVLLIIEIAANVLEQQLESINFGETGQLRVVNKQNRMIYTPVSDEIGAMFPFTLSENESITYQQDAHAIEHLIVHHPSEKNEWQVVGYIEVNELLQETKSISQVTFIMAACAIGFAVLIGWLAVRMFGNPLVRLNNIMKMAESGNLTIRTEFKSKDEIGQLGESFNRMMVNFTSLIEKTNDSAQKVRDLAGTLLQSSRSTASSANEVVVVMKEIATGSSTLSQESEKTNQLTNEMYGMLNVVSAANDQMSEIARTVKQESDNGIRYLKDVVEQMNETNRLTRDMFDKVNDLGQSLASIRTVLDLISRLTKQTNILALNAGIEAERAGAAGKGFKVISNEIRNLAEESKNSIEVVDHITQKIQNDIEDTMKSLERVSPVFEAQINTLHQTDQIFNQVSNSMLQYMEQLNEVIGYIEQLQRTGKLVNESMHSVSAISQESAASTEQVAALSTEQLGISQKLVTLSESMEQLSEQLKDSLSMFKI